MFCNQYLTFSAIKKKKPTTSARQEAISESDPKYQNDSPSSNMFRWLSSYVLINDLIVPIYSQTKAKYHLINIYFCHPKYFIVFLKYVPESLITYKKWE